MVTLPSLKLPSQTAEPFLIIFAPCPCAGGSRRPPQRNRCRQDVRGLEQPELEARRLAHYLPDPWRIPYEIDRDFFLSVDAQKFVARFIGNHCAHAAARRGESHPD